MRLKFFEYTDGKLIKTVSNYFGSDGELYEKSITNFDSLGRAVQAFGLKPDGKPIGDGRYIHEYDEDGRELRTLSFNDLDDTNIPNHISNFVYKCDEQGNWTERGEYSRFKSDPDRKKQNTTRRLTYYPQAGI